MAIDRDAYTAYIKTVFNYYNGKINIINQPAVLDINWLKQPQCLAGGWSKSPNKVILNPQCMIDFYDNIVDVILFTVEAVIHELYHTDQLIDYNRMMEDELYRAQIESACEIEAKLYMANHQNEIMSLTGGYCLTAEYCMEMVRKLERYRSRYRRATIIEHIWSILINLVYLNLNERKELYDILQRTISNSIDMLMVLNGDEIWLFKDNVFTDIKYINAFFLKYTKDMSCDTSLEINTDKYMTINMEITPAKILCTPVRK